MGGEALLEGKVEGPLVRYEASSAGKREKEDER